ncbi:MAG TPA: type IV secretion system protein [Acidobacteriota bacterium]|nr:type IV secretion system protein [Acidobacteriota bacterium]
MPENTFALGTLIDIIWQAIHGEAGGYDIAGAFQDFGGILWQIMCLWAFAHEAIDMAMGKGTNLPKLLLRWAIISAVILAWPSMADHLYTAADNLAGAVIPKLQDVFNLFKTGYCQMQNTDQTAVTQQGFLGLFSSIAAIPSAMMINQISTIGGAITIVCFAILLVSLAGVFMIFALYLIMGPVFIALGMTDTFSSFMYKWIGVVLSFFLVIPLYGAALAIIIALYGSSVINMANIQGLPSMDHVFNMIIGPILSVGLILGVNKVASTLTGSYFGQAGSMAFAIGTAAAGIGARLGLSAATAGAGAPAAGTAGSAGSAGAVTAAVSGSASSSASAAARES